MMSPFIYLFIFFFFFLASQQGLHVTQGPCGGMGQARARSVPLAALINDIGSTLKLTHPLSNFIRVIKKLN